MRTTGQSLVLLRNVLLTLTALTLVVSWLSFQAVRGTVDTVRTDTAPAVLGITNARIALAEAERAVNESFASGHSPLTGPGERYQNQIALGGQALTQVAEDNVAGERGRVLLRSVEGLLVDYIGLIEQADAHQDRERDAVPPLATANLWYASGLMDDVQNRLVTLSELQRAALTGQISPPGRLLTDLAPPVLAVTSLIALIRAQTWLRRRFRRRVNPALVAATVLTAGIAAIGLLNVMARQDLDHAVTTLDQAVDTRGTVVAANSAQGDTFLRAFLDRQCAGMACGVSVERFRPPPTHPTDSAQDAAAKSERAATAIATADISGLEPLLPTAAACVGVLITLGLWPRLAEYRFPR